MCGNGLLNIQDKKVFLVQLGVVHMKVHQQKIMLIAEIMEIQHLHIIVLDLELQFIKGQFGVGSIFALFGAAWCK